MRKVRRRAKVSFLSAPALRLLFATLDPRRERHSRLLFRLPAAAYTRGYAWIPRLWWVRAGAVFRRCLNETLRIYRGRRFRRLLVQRWNVGFAWGSFARTQTLAVFKKRASAKKRRKQTPMAAATVFDFRLQRLKEVRAGTRRKGVLQLDSHVEAQLRGLN